MILYTKGQTFQKGNPMNHNALATHIRNTRTPDLGKFRANTPVQEDLNFIQYAVGMDGRPVGPQFYDTRGQSQGSGVTATTDDGGSLSVTMPSGSRSRRKSSRRLQDQTPARRRDRVADRFGDRRPSQDSQELVQYAVGMDGQPVGPQLYDTRGQSRRSGRITQTEAQRRRQTQEQNKPSPRRRSRTDSRFQGRRGASRTASTSQNQLQERNNQYRIANQMKTYLFTLSAENRKLLSALLALQGADITSAEVQRMISGDASPFPQYTTMLDNLSSASVDDLIRFNNAAREYASQRQNAIVYRKDAIRELLQ